MAAIEKNRIFFIDYLRAFMVLLVVLEHAGLPYSPLFKQTAYIGDFGGELFFDILHYHNDAVMMPFLFMLAGMFVLPSLQRRGFLSFCQEKFRRLVIPFVLGVAFLVPPQTYFKYLVKVDPNMTYLHYLTDVFFAGHMSASGFWFLYYLFVLTFGFLILQKMMPSLKTKLGQFVLWMVEKPISGFFVFASISVVLLTIGDLFWGPFWWLGFADLFYVRGSRFLVKIFFFLVGIGLSEAMVFQRTELTQKIQESWPRWLALVLMVGAMYMSYSILNFEEAYTYEFLRHWRTGGTLLDGLPIILENYPVLIRTTLLGVFMSTLTVFYFTMFLKFLNQPSVIWMSLAASSFGIYIFHEPIQVGLTYLFYQVDLSDYLKFLIVVGISGGVSWGLVQKVLLRTPGFKKIL